MFGLEGGYMTTENLGNAVRYSAALYMRLSKDDEGASGKLKHYDTAENANVLCKSQSLPHL